MVEKVKCVVVELVKRGILVGDCVCVDVCVGVLLLV